MTDIEFREDPLQHKCSEPLLESIRDLFNSYFDYPWLINIIDELPVNLGNIGYIRTFLALNSIYPIQESIILNGISSLKTMVRIINIWLIPESSDIFKISAFTENKSISNPTLRKCVAYTLPLNTMKLSTLITELEKEIIRECLVIN
jgi:hypothetical protein